MEGGGAIHRLRPPPQAFMELILWLDKNDRVIIVFAIESLYVKVTCGVANERQWKKYHFYAYKAEIVKSLFVDLLNAFDILISRFKIKMKLIQN